MKPDISMSPLRVLDAKRLRSTGIFPGKIQEVLTRIREMLSDSQNTVFLASDTEDPEKIPLALCCFSQMHPVHRSAALELFFPTQEVRSEDEDEIAPCEIIRLEKKTDLRITDPMKRRIIDAALRIAFFTLHLHRVSILIPVSEHRLGDLFIESGMKQEAVLEEALCVNETFVDAGLFSLLASEYPDYGVAFVPFPQGVVAVRGSSVAVEGVRFYRYGQEIEDPYERLVAIRTGVAGAGGALRTSGAEEYNNSCQGCPEEVTKGARELREYFMKSRTNFTVRIHFPFGSDFQRHVWAELSRIPYGSTVSYEDVALSLTGNDKVAARNLSRAVGSACAENPIPIIIPCHRVIGKDGRLVGFSGGVENKEFLLDHEMFGFFRDTIKDHEAVASEKEN